MAAVCFLMAGVSVVFADDGENSDVKIFGISYMMPDGTMILDSYLYSETDAFVLPLKEEFQLSKKIVEEGWTFMGWFSDPGYTKAVTQIEPLDSGDKKFYARLEKTLDYSYTEGNQEISGFVTIYGGESDSAIGVSIAEDIGGESPVKNENSCFSYEYTETWIRDQETQKFVPDFMAIPKKYGIEFVLPEGVAIENLPEIYECGKKTLLPEVSMEGWNFYGWGDGEDSVSFIADDEFGDKILTALLEKIEVKNIKVVYGDGEEDFVWVKAYVTDTEAEILAKINQVVVDSAIVPDKESDMAYLYEQDGWFELGQDVYVPRFEAIAKPVSARVVYDVENGSYVTVVIRATDTGSDIEKNIAKAIEGKPLPKKASSNWYDYTFCGWSKDLVNGTFVFTPDFDSTRIVKEEPKEEQKESLNAWGAVATAQLSLEGRTLEINGVSALVQVFDMRGRKVLETVANGSNCRLEFPRAGSYVVKVASEVKRFVVK